LFVEPFNSIKARTEIIKEANTAIEAMLPLRDLDSFLPKKPLTRKPSKGNKGTNGINFIIEKRS
jgi:hypothetical protein